MSYPEKPLDQLIDINPQVKLEKGVTYPFIPMEEISPGRRYVNAKSYRVAGGGAKFCHEDTLFARITPCLENGKIAQYVSTPSQIAFGSTEYWVFRSRKGISDPAYVFYLANSEIIRKPAEKSMAGASGRQRADIAAVENISVPAPPLPIQRRIASILSAYDNLIENNTRRIAILEEMARRIYEEWFVHFRFPGHEKVKMVDSELGKIPEGWKVKAIPDAIDINPTTRLQKDGLKPFVPMNCLSDNSMVITGHKMREGNSGSKFKNGDTLFARITPCLENGKTGFVQFLPNDATVAFGSTEFSVLRSKSLSSEIVYLLSRTNSFRDNAIKSMSGATGRQRVKESCFDSYLFAHPNKEIILNFTELVSPMFKEIFVLQRKNANLRTTRDFLLPKLISGEIDVSKLPEPEDATV